ncbi:MAG: nitroreductase family protein [Bacillota bacterium]
MNVYDAIRKRRTIRKFTQQPIDVETLTKLVDAARLAPQGANLQPVKYLVVNEAQLLNSIFAATKWAAYIHPHGTPGEGERPTAYVVVLVDTEIKKAGYDIDAGAAVENMLLAAVEEGLGSAWLGAIDRDQIRSLLAIPERYIIHTLVALGYPGEDPTIEDAGELIKYYKDEQGRLHVPKRRLQDLLFFNGMES